MYVGPDVVKLVVVNTEVTAAKVLVGVHDVLNSLRDKEDLYTELDLANPQWTDVQFLDFMVQHPVLINRPIVATPLGARLCRPHQVVNEVLPTA